jgi:hypothetical protein
MVYGLRGHLFLKHTLYPIIDELSFQDGYLLYGLPFLKDLVALAITLEDSDGPVTIIRNYSIYSFILLIPSSKIFLQFKIHLTILLNWR